MTNIRKQKLAEREISQRDPLCSYTWRGCHDGGPEYGL